MATFVRDFTQEFSYKYHILSHFVGAAPYSTNHRLTLIRLCKELSRVCRVFPQIPEDFNELKEKLPELLQQFMAAKKKEKVLLVIDAVNQFDDQNNASSLEWL